MSKPPEDPTAFFWQVAERALSEDGVQRATMMGFPCLRVDGAFFASCDHRSGALIVKLRQERVKGLIAAGAGQPFAPAGRTFREWVLVAERDAPRWRALIDEAREFADPTIADRV